MKIMNMKVEYLGSTDEKGLNEIIKGPAIGGRISRRKGKVSELKQFVEEKTYEDNIRFIRKILGYGHTAITELQYVVMTLEDISIILEHYLIGKRFTAFTGKSRRECDVSNDGIFKPTFHNANGDVHEKNEVFQELFFKNAQNLIDAYQLFIDEGIRYEDARYVLPYVFSSNLVMALTVHELCLITNDLLYGHISNIEEAKCLGGKFKGILLQVAPYTDISILSDEEMLSKFHHFLLKNKESFTFDQISYLFMMEQKLIDLLKNSQKGIYQYKVYETIFQDLNSYVDTINESFIKELKQIIEMLESYILITVSNRVNLSTDYLSFLDDFPVLRNHYDKKTHLLHYYKDADQNVILSSLMSRYQISYENAKKHLSYLKSIDKDIEKKIIHALMMSPHDRSLEQVTYQFSFTTSLAVATHLERQRLHSFMFPSFFPVWDLNQYIIPEDIKNNENLCQIFSRLVKENIQLFSYLKQSGVKESDLVYFYISGNVFEAITTLNAKYLIYLSRLRTCKKSQAETVQIFESMCEEVKKVNPLIGDCLGPTCQILGYCKEGKDSCKRKLRKNKNI